jgi:hypothetical protein
MLGLRGDNWQAWNGLQPVFRVIENSSSFLLISDFRQVRTGMCLLR